jgi:hypothetical protein
MPESPPLRPRTALRLLVAGAALVVVAFVALVVAHGNGSEPDVDCSTFRPTPARWARGDYEARRQVMDGVNACGLLRGRTRAGIAALLGPPDADRGRELDYDLPFDRPSTDRQVWRLYLGADGRYKSSTVESPAGGR